MVKTMTINEIEELFNGLREWGITSKEIKLSPKNLYYLISFKKTIEDEHLKVVETVQTIFANNDIHPGQDGTYHVDDSEKMESINKELTTFGETTVDIHYEPIGLKDTDSIPVNYVEKLFDFIKLED